MISRRVPDSFEPSEWSRRLAALRSGPAPLLDLTESDPTRTGLGGAGERELAALADPRAARYEADPRGLSTARAALAAALTALGRPVTPERLLLTSGTSESYAHLISVLCDPGDVVLAPRPGYPLVDPIAALAGVRVESYRLDWDGRWHLDVATLDEAIARAGGRARAVIVVQPNNPTGSCLAPDEILALERRCAEHGLAIVADEVFADSPRPGRPPLPTLLGDRPVPVAVLGGLSKSVGMPQLKLAWIALAGAGCGALGDALEWVADLFLSVATPVQLALPALLAAHGRFHAGLERRLAGNLERLAALTARQPAAQVLDADGGWVAILRLPTRRDATGWALALLDRGVAVQPGDLYDLEIGASVVVSLLPEPATFDAACARIEAALDEP